MDSRVDSLVGLFSGTGGEGGGDGAEIDRIEIPLIQRDFAQGRTDDAATRIRAAFLDALHEAAVGGEPAGLDFVYGEVTEGVLRPLDGQQRLTTLFLLHWYVSGRTANLDAEAGWAQFTYATRPGARRFCQNLVQHELPADVTPSNWICDQPWYQYVWQHDPTVQSMLVMLDSIHDRFRLEDLDAVWARLVDPDAPAISFHLLAIDDMGSAEDLYIKMNSRGKPLTEFETFKAQLIKALDGSERVDQLATQLDGRWADVMWSLGDQASLFDDKFLNYIEFIIDLCEWRGGSTRGFDDDIVVRARRVFGPDSPDADENLDLLFASFEVWLDGPHAVVDSRTVFRELFTTSAEPAGDGRVRSFETVQDLFRACCDGGTSNRRALMLYAVLLHRIHEPGDVLQRLRNLRHLRNLIEGSINEIRVSAMPKLVGEVERIVVHGELNPGGGFNTEACEDEVRKREFLRLHPRLETALNQLEDDDVLRGCLMAFELGAASFAHRAEAFRRILAPSTDLAELTGALLAVGDYARPLGAAKYRFGTRTKRSQWRDLLSGGAPTREGMTATRAVLGELLDEVDLNDPDVDTQLANISRAFVDEAVEEERYDWRYYLVRYRPMRRGASGVYATPRGPLGFCLCMLEGTHLNGHYRDPFLFAIVERAKAHRSVTGEITHHSNGPWFTGHATSPRRMRLLASNTGFENVDLGFLLTPPRDPDQRAAFEEVCASHGAVEDDHGNFELPTQLRSGLDRTDRVVLGAELLTALLDAGL